MRRRRRRLSSRDHEAHVARLVDEVGLVRAAGRVGVLEREDRRGDDVAGARPGAQQRGVRAGVTAKPWPNTISGNGPARVQRVADDRDQPARPGGPPGSGSCGCGRRTSATRSPTANGAARRLGRRAALGRAVVGDRCSSSSPRAHGRRGERGCVARTAMRERRGSPPPHPSDATPPARASAGRQRRSRDRPG